VKCECSNYSQKKINFYHVCVCDDVLKCVISVGGNVRKSVVKERTSKKKLLTVKYG